jgi:FAD/FMN-containing dehydrogenase
MPHTQPQDTELESLKSIVGPRGWYMGKDTDRYLEDPRGRERGSASIVLCPTHTSQVSEIMKFCNASGIGVIPFGGGTGGALGHMDPTGGGLVVLSLERMKKIRQISAEDDAIVAEAGVILADIQSASDGIDRFFGLSLASEGSCTIGGNLASNAGGIQALRYGNTRDLCLGIEAVMPDGSILNDLHPLRKDNTGYDLRHLLIGSEGTLGVITAASLKLAALPEESVTVMCAVESPRAALALLQHLRRALGDVVSAFELMSELGLNLALKHFPDLRDPFQETHAWYIIATIAGAKGTQDGLEASLAQAFEGELVADGVVSSSNGQSASLWALRERAFEYNKLEGVLYSSDTSVPLSRIGDFVDTTAARLGVLDPGLRANFYGHIGDGNIHVNVFPAEGVAKVNHIAKHPDAAANISHIIDETTHLCGGSISAEHGIGRAKNTTLKQYADPTKLAVMRMIKQAVDSKNIMNPGALF